MRFPDLYNMLGFSSHTPSSLLSSIPKNYEILPSIKDEKEHLTLKIKDKFIHSKYNPISEAKKTYDALIKDNIPLHSFCFFGIGLAYLSELFIKEQKDVRIVLIEPDIFIFILFLASRDLSDVFSHKNLIIIPATTPSETLLILENLNINLAHSFYFKSSLDISRGWIEEFRSIRERHRQKNELNCNTLKKFYARWLRNFMQNIEHVFALEGISYLKNAFSSIPCIIFAAGPSLDEHIEILKPYQDNFIIIAVDTSLIPLQEAGINPDFVILMDGQYLNFLHIMGAKATSSILITESTVYPSVFREDFRKIYLASSSFPLAKYIEDFLESKGVLSSGGSVATSSWDMARLFSCTPIIMAGLDLAFTKGKTHSISCRFEKESLIFSDKFHTLETAIYRLQDRKNTFVVEGYKGAVLSDAKMKMFAWWFESKIEEYPNILTYNFMPSGLKIPNMKSIDKKELLSIIKNSPLIDKKTLLSSIIKNKIPSSKTSSHKKMLKNIFKKIYFHFSQTKDLLKEAIDYIKDVIDTPECLFKIIIKIEKTNEKIKKDIINKYIKSVELELEKLFYCSFQNYKPYIEKTLKLYSLLKDVLEQVLRR